MRDRSQREPNLRSRVDVPTIHSADPLILGRDRSQREPNLENRVDVPTIHSADPLIFPLLKQMWADALS